MVRAAFSPDGKLATAASDKSARIWDAKTGALPTPLGHDRAVTQITSAPTVRASSPHRRTRRRASGTPRQVRPLVTLAGHDRAVSRAAFSPDGSGS